MLKLRKATDRGHANHGWLDSHHTFSFADYYDPAHQGFRALRVINDDTVAPGRGFGKHPHRDMEIVTYVLDGALAHGDSMGTTSVIKPGEVQRMSAGTGVVHSEHNASPSEPVHFLQIWLIPDQRGLPPSYEQKAFAAGERAGKLRLVASPDGTDGSVTIHSDGRLYTGTFDRDQRAELALAAGRHAWIHVARGRVRVNGHELGTGDGLAVSDERAIAIDGIERAEVLVFDLG